MIVLDTDVLLWWALDPVRLSAAATERLSEMERRGGFASAISIWELLPVDTATWLRSLALAWDHRDPADRVIVATAIVRGVPLMTADDEIRRFTGVTSLW